MVKNRCKNGDYYWVLANATPVWEAGQVVGYMSVRRKATREQIAAADAAYRLFRDRQQGGLRIRYGEVVRGGDSALANMSLAKKLGIVLGLLCVALFVQAGIGVFVTSRTNAAAESLYEQRLEPVRLIGRIGKLMADNRAQILLGLQHDPEGVFAKAHEHPLTMHTDAVQKNIAEITALWQQYQPLIHGDDHRAMADAYAEARKRYVQEGLLPARQALLDGKFGDANAVVLAKINPTYHEAGGKADLLFTHLSERSKSQIADMRQEYQYILLLTLAGVVVIGLLSMIAAVWLFRSIMRPLGQVVNTLNNVSQGNYSNKIDVTQNNELGKVLQNLQSMQTRLGFEVAETGAPPRETLPRAHELIRRWTAAESGRYACRAIPAPAVSRPGRSRVRMKASAVRCRSRYSSMSR
jgi:methyl-accepting chemotaxis protein